MLKVINLYTDSGLSELTLPDNLEFLKAMGIDEYDEEEIFRYFGACGDYWYDCDMVRWGGVTKHFNCIPPSPSASASASTSPSPSTFLTSVLSAEEEASTSTDGYLIANFDPLEYPEHIALIQLWSEAYKNQQYWDLPNALFTRDGNDSLSAFVNAPNAIAAYRGGQDYSCGIYILP